MLRYWKRLMMAFCVSAGCYWGTHFWYENEVSGSYSVTDKEPIAVLSDKLNEVQRKPLARVIWENLSSGENLYAGESIRTTPNSEAKILFIQSKAVIELEPDSQVVLEESKDGLALNFLKGNLFVKGGKKGGAGAITLKSGNSKIALDDASLSLSKSKKGNVDLQVYEGSAELEQDGKTVALDKDKSGAITDKGIKQVDNIIKIVSPTPGQPIYIDPRKKEPVLFRWEKLPPGYQVFLEGGRKRNKLKRFSKIFTKGEAGELKVPLKVGKFYWRLVANPTPGSTVTDKRKSQTLSAQVVAKLPPTPLEPENESRVAVKPDNEQIRLKWASPITYQRLTLQLASDPKLQKLIQNIDDIEAKTMAQEVKITQSGTYYWRVTGWMDINGKLEPVSSSIQKFDLQVGVRNVPPVLRSPVAGQQIPFRQVQESGTFLTWDPVPGIKEYKITFKDLKRKKTHEKNALSSPLKLKALKPGDYEWYAQSINPEDDTLSKKSEVRKFRVEDLPKVEWANGSDPEDFYYVTNKPYLKAEWLPVKSQSVASYRFRFAESGGLDSDVKWIASQKTFLRKWVDGDGEYDVQVEALDAKKKPLARSSVKTITVQSKPLLPAPTFASTIPDQLKSSRRGNVTLKWEAVDGAKEYKVFVKDQAGKILREETVSRNTASLKRLKPGEYTYSVQAIDKHDRAGAESGTKALAVPKFSNIRAPKIKGIKVK